MNNVEPLTPGHLTQLGLAFSGSALAFYGIFELLYHIFESKAGLRKQSPPLWVQEYRKWTPMQRADFVSRITSQLHALIAIGFALKALFFICVEPSSDGTVDYKHGTLTNFFMSEYCLMEHVAMVQMISLAITAGYLTFDIYICYAKIQDKSNLQTQTYIHHGVGISGIVSAILYGRGGALIITNVLLINEFSTIFLNFRQFLLIFKMNEGRLYKVNAVLFFLSFFLSRIVFNTVVSYFVYKAFIITIKDRGVLGCPWWQIILGFYLIFLFIVINVLNAVWLIGIVKHLLRNIGVLGSKRRGGEHRPRQGAIINGQQEEEKEGLLVEGGAGSAPEEGPEVTAGGERRSVNESQGSLGSNTQNKNGVRKRETSNGEGGY